MFITIILFIVMLSALVLIHEAGHFFVARKMGIKVEEFGLGLPPRLWGKKFGETEYTINALPIGGFVRMYGETPDGVSIRQEGHDDDSGRMFLNKSKLARTAVLLAGVTANLLLGAIIFSIVFTAGLPVYRAKIVPSIDQVNAGSPADQAGLQPGDTIVALDGVAFDQVKPSFSQKVSSESGQTLHLTINHQGQNRQVDITSRKNPPAGQGAMGVTLQAQTVVDHVERYPFYQAPIEGFKQAAIFAWAILVGLGGIVNQASHGTVPTDVAGPVGIATILGQARGLGWTYVLWFAGIISVNLAVVNVLPLPALDGGRLLFVIIEAITGRKVNQRVEQLTHTIGMAVLLLLIVLITFSDISKLIH
jgi:regulator of sigma E protease